MDAEEVVNPRERAKKKIKNKTVVQYNETDRRKFLTGFHARKVERRKQALKEQKFKLRKQKIEERKTRRDIFVQHARKLQDALKDKDPDEKEETEELQNFPSINEEDDGEIEEQDEKGSNEESEEKSNILIIITRLDWSENLVQKKVYEKENGETVTATVSEFDFSSMSFGGDKIALRNPGKISKKLKLSKPQTQAPKKKFKPSHKKKFNNKSGGKSDKGKGGKRKRK